MDIAMTKGFAASTDTISIDANSDDKEILEIVKTANLDAKTLKSLIYNFSENTPKDTLSAEDKEILQFIKNKNLDLKKLDDLLHNFTNNDFKNNLRDLKKDPRPVVQKILAFMEKEKIDIKEMEKRAGFGRGSLRVFLYSGLSNNMKLPSLIKITNLMQVSLDEFILDMPVPMSRKKNVNLEEVEQSIKTKILDFLDKNKISKNKLEKITNIHEGAILKLYQNNRTKIPETHSLITIAQTMKCSLESFLPN